jgi:amino acid permease
MSVSLPIFIFGFTCQQNVLNCFRELREPTVRRMKKVVTRQIFIASAIYLSVGCFGYLTFGNQFSATEENILTKYKDSNVSVFVVSRSN